MYVCVEQNKELNINVYVFVECVQNMRIEYRILLHTTFYVSSKIPNI